MSPKCKIGLGASCLFLFLNICVPTTVARYVLEALRKPPTNAHNIRMLRFGMFALEQFKTRLPRWPQYCQHILNIPHLRELNPTLVAEITLCLQQVDFGRSFRFVLLYSLPALLPPCCAPSSETGCRSAHVALHMSLCTCRSAHVAGRISGNNGM